MKKALIALITLASISLSATAAVGDWKIYMAYSEPQQIQEVGNYLFVQASNSLYLYNKNDQSIQTFDKSTGMNDVVITNIAWNEKAKRLVIVYDNSNIDLMDLQGNVINVPDLYNKTMTGDKTVNSITNSDKFAYLATNFGGVKLDVSKAEISESYLLDFGSRIIREGTTDIYLRSIDWKVYKCSKTSNAQDKSNWQETQSWPGISLNIDNSAYDNNIELVKTLKPDGPKYNYFGFMKYQNNRLYSTNGLVSIIQDAIFQELNNNSWKIYEYENINEKTGVNYQNFLCFDIDPTNPNHIFIGGRNGLYEYNDGNFVKFYSKETGAPIGQGLENNKEYEIIGGVIYDKKGNLWCINCLSLENNILTLDNKGSWNTIQKKELMKMPSGKTLSALSNMIFDNDGNIWFVNNNWIIPGVYRYNIENNDIICFESFINQDGTTINNNGSSCVALDRNGDMWIGTSFGPLLLRKENFNNANTTFEQVKVPRNDGTNLADYLLNGISVTSIVIDKANRKWIGTNDNGLYLISNDNIEEIHHFTTNNSYLLSNNILSLALNETSGEIFIGTDKGLCSYSSDATTDYEEMTSDNMYAYPNPVTPDYNGIITVVGLSFNANVKILNTNGSVIAEGKSNGGSFTWDGKNKKGEKVASGVYMVTTATESGEKGAVCKITLIK